MGTKAAQPEREPAWDGVVRRSINITTRAVDVESRSVEVIASTDSIDSHGDIVEQDWDLSRYEKNSPVLWHHNRFESSPWSFGGAVRPEDLLPIGHAQDVRVEGGKLVAKIVFGSEKYNPMSEKCFLGFKEGHLKAVSVGFYPGKITEEQAPGGVLYRLSECELLEISVVPIPSNPDAVAKSIAFERKHLARMAGNQTAVAEGQNTMMTPEEKAAYEAAQVEARSAKDRAEKSERELAAEKANSEKLSKDLASASERAKKAEDLLIEQEISALVGKKLTPAEKDEEIALAKEIGLERVKARLSKRPDIAITAPVEVDGKGVKTAQPAPAPADGAGNGSDDIVKSAMAAANAA